MRIICLLVVFVLAAPATPASAGCLYHIYSNREESSRCLEESRKAYETERKRIELEGPRAKPEDVQALELMAALLRLEMELNRQVDDGDKYCRPLGPFGPPRCACRWLPDHDSHSCLLGAK
jgi:hypothetical protein